MRYKHIPLVTVSEAVKLSMIQADFEHTSEHAEAIYTAAFQRVIEKSSAGVRFAEYASIFAVYTAGRLQGIREERQRRKAHG